MDLPSLSFYAFLDEQWDEEEEPENIENLLKVVPPSYNHYLDVFSKVKAEKLPPHCACDHHIKLVGLLPLVGVIYSLSNHESETLQAYISENVEKGFIRASSSSAGEPVLFVKKKDGGLHLCVDYHKLNAVTRKNRYSVPPINQLLSFFNGSTIFSKIDFHGAYKLLRIKEGDEHLTAFRSKYGSYEFLVMQFGLTNAPSSFQNLVNDILSDFLSIFIVVYLDDIMVFSSSEEEYVKHVASLLQRLRDNNLFSKASKCVFHASSVEYLGYVFQVKLKISRDLSTAFFPETDGQTERVNQILEQYLPIKNTGFDSTHISQDTPAGKLSTKLQSVQKVFKEELESAIRRFKKYADRNRESSPDFQPGQKVFLSSDHIKKTGLTKNPSERLLGPFEFLKKIGRHAYHLKLPQQWNSVHPVIHVSLLEPVKQSTIPNTSICTTTSHSGRARRMGSGSGSGLKTQDRYIMVCSGVERIQ
ncbi:hypothetical protein O181_015600 [Austropuccinia psidii MF-1]|uniref:Reverse transcriptase domain-containing protein n=1 Tax=Austropuccinia psidii MF-1 TaxID=1389203 RepID=A0A9Q3GR41_9BASI|nr:hypothetical protein [Austropuccinia psidii MF-1]